MREKKFRKDLFYRMPVFESKIPALPHRGVDIPIVDHMVTSAHP